MELHPDRNKAADATAQFQLLNEAYGVLRDPTARAQYDTISIEANEPALTTSEEPVEPIVCSCCRKVTAQPRYVIFQEVKSFIFVTNRAAIQGIFCSLCAYKKALKATAVTWLLGWWGFPWGFIYSIQAIFNNMLGGRRPANINSRLAAHQAWVFASLGKIDMARAIALDALQLAKTIKPDGAYAKKRAALGYDEVNEGVEIRNQLEKLLAAMGGVENTARLKDAWGRFRRRPFYIQGAVALGVIGILGCSIQNESPSLPPSGPKPYLTDSQPVVQQVNRQVAQSRPAYVRPVFAPNGEAWPLQAGYVPGYPLLRTDGLSQVTIDNSQNDSDVFVKLVSLDGPNAFPVRAFFVPAHGRFTVQNIMAGGYDVRYRDLNTGHLSRSQAFKLQEIPGNDGTQYSDVTLTLYKVSNGNM
jgi:hypothetical protein